MKAPVQNHSAPSILAVLVLGLSAIYLLPYLVPVHDGLSDSYLFGYSNRTAIILLLAFILGFALWTRGLGLRLPDPVAGSSDRFRRTGIFAIASSAFGCALFWMLARAFGPLMESQYFLDRYAMFSTGGHLYRDFTFYYGPLMFYPSVWIARLCHISLGNGYFLAWSIQFTLGTWILWKVVEVAAWGTSHGRLIFLLLWAFFLTGMPDTGLNYTPLRFCAALLFALGVHSLFARGASRLAIFGLASVGATTMLLYSPEQGIAFTIGTILFFVLCVRPARMDLLAGLGAFVLVMSMVFWLALRLGVFGSLSSVGGGTLDFPLLFSFQTVVLLLLLTVAGCVFIASLRTHASHSPLLYLVCLSLVSTPAAFSRADVGHIIINTLGALVASLVVLSQYRLVWRWTWPAFAIMLVLATYGKYTLYKDTIQIQIHDAVFVAQDCSPVVDKAYISIYKLIHRNAQVRLDRIRASVNLSLSRNTLPLPSHVTLLAPFGVQRRLTPSPDGIRIVTGRYPSLYPITTSSAIQTKISEIQAHPDWPLLLTSEGTGYCEYNRSQERLGLQKFLLPLYMPPLRHTILTVEPLCDYIGANYIASHYASPVPQYVVWVRKGNTSVAPDIQ